MKAPEIDEFVSKHPEILHLKVNICSNKTINEVFYSIISIAQDKNGSKAGDPKGALIGEKELSQKMKEQPSTDVGLKHVDDINAGEVEKKKCTIF